MRHHQHYYVPLFILVIVICSFSAFAATTTKSTAQQTKTYETNISRRERNLDHWDAETLGAYLGLDPDTAEPLPESDSRYVGIDASIMFYARWCSNCQRFAPIWDTIGTLVEAGTTQSNLIMALFNCELNDQHTKLCNAAGVTHYPTLMFAGAGPYVDSDPVSSFLLGSKDKSAGPYGSTPLKRTVKFQGNLNVGDSVLDWIRTMQGLSKWYQWGHMEGGWLKTIRSLFFIPFGGKKKSQQAMQKNALPIGVPSGTASTGGVSTGTGTGTGTNASGSTKSAYVLQKELKQAEKEAETLKTDLEEKKVANEHAGYLINAFLFPKMSTPSDDEEGSATPLDVFAVLDETKGWDESLSSKPAGSTLSVEDDKALLIKACVVDSSLDYCTRVSKKLTNDYLANISKLDAEKEDYAYPTFTEMESELRGIVKKEEPYCAMFDSCYSGNFEGEGCRPQTCPFTNPAGCTYVGGCLSKEIMEEYKVAVEAELAAKKEE
jgi:hypothetical protein